MKRKCRAFRIGYYIIVIFVWILQFNHKRPYLMLLHSTQNLTRSRYAMGVCSLGQWQWKRTVLFEDDPSVPDAEKITHRFASLKKKKPTDRMHFYYVGLEHKKPSLYVFYLWKGSENCFEIPTYVTQMYLHFHPLSKWLFSRTMHSGMLVDISQLTLKKKIL